MLLLTATYFRLKKREKSADIQKTGSFNGFLAFVNFAKKSNPRGCDLERSGRGTRVTALCKGRMTPIVHTGTERRFSAELTKRREISGKFDGILTSSSTGDAR